MMQRQWQYVNGKAVTKVKESESSSYQSDQILLQRMRQNSTGPHPQSSLFPNRKHVKKSGVGK